MGRDERVGALSCRHFEKLQSEVTYTCSIDHDQELSFDLVVVVGSVEVDASLVRQEYSVLAFNHRGGDQKEDHADKRGACTAIATS